MDYLEKISIFVFIIGMLFLFYSYYSYEIPLGDIKEGSFRSKVFVEKISERDNFSIIYFTYLSHGQGIIRIDYKNSAKGNISDLLNKEVELVGKKKDDFIEITQIKVS